MVDIFQNIEGNGDLCVSPHTETVMDGEPREPNLDGSLGVHVTHTQAAHDPVRLNSPLNQVRDSIQFNDHVFPCAKEEVLGSKEA